VTQKTVLSTFVLPASILFSVLLKPRGKYETQFVKMRSHFQHLQFYILFKIYYC